FSGPKTSIICSPMTSLKTSIKTITYLSDIGCLEIQGASLVISGSILLNWDLTEKIFGKMEKCMSWENTRELFEKGTVKERAL
ncbi:hypothetical protein, partial [Escherichia coli]|uniref:hypothetical protein n=1 Tax=Escherichia coli TaxID=562 RepID=UPI00201E9348